MPKAAGVNNLRNAGIANHGVGPVFGTAATAASLIGIPEDRISDLLTYCAQQASGSWQWLMDVEHIEKAFVFAGMGARNGLQAALMVEGIPRRARQPTIRTGGCVRARSRREMKPAYLVEQLGVRNSRKQRLNSIGRRPDAASAGCTSASQDRPNNVTPFAWRCRAAGRLSAIRPCPLNLRYTLSLMLIDGKLDFVSAQSLQHGDRYKSEGADGEDLHRTRSHTRSASGSAAQESRV